MESSVLVMKCAAAIGLFTILGTLIFMLYRKFRCRHNNETKNPSPVSPSPYPSSLPRNWIHHVFPSFHGADVRRSFLSHILKEFRSKGIDPFIDNEIMRGEFIGPELRRAIQGSRIAIVLLSKNYASSSWCLDELVEIMKCMEELDQTVMVIFYEVDPTDVKKQTGEFGKVFRNTCAGRTKDDVGKWKQALTKVATIAGYHSSNWDNEADMIEEIATDVSNKLILSTASRDFDGLVGMGAHMEKIDRVLRLDLDEVRMIGIWGPAGIGKSTIARCLFNQLSENFQLTAFMANIRATYTTPLCSDDYNTKLHLQQKFVSQIINQKDIKIPHLGVAQERLNDKKVLVVLDDVDRLVQLEAMAKETQWFGHGSRIIITTQDIKLLKAHGINHIYKVNFPPTTEALQIFCMYAFGQKSPKDGFDKLSLEVTVFAGTLPLGLRVMGSYFKGMSKQEWTNELPRLRTSLHDDIESILKFSYDGLRKEEKKLFLHITCFFNFVSIEIVEDFLAKTFSNVRQGLHILAEKSLIHINSGRIEIHHLLILLGKEIVRNQSASDPGKRQFLIDASDIGEVLSDDTSGSRSVIGIDLKIEEELNVSERAFERMSNLQFLKISGDYNRLYFPRSLNSISRKIRLLDWRHYPMTCLPSNFNPEFLVKLYLTRSKLEKLWDGVQPVRNLKWLDLSFSTNLKELPDLSTATNLEILNLNECSSLVELPFFVENANNLQTVDLTRCSSLVELPSSVGNATNLTCLHLHGCSSLLKLPSSIGNATKLKNLDLTNCSSMVELPFSIGNLHNLVSLILKDCSKLRILPININMESLDELDLSGCSMLKTFPEMSTNIRCLKLNGTAVEEVPLTIRSWSRLEVLHMSYCENLKDLPHALDSITELHLTNTEIEEVPPCIERITHLRRLVLKCRKLVSLQQLPDSLLFLDAENCESLERLDCSFYNPNISLNFANCFKLNQEAIDLIIQTSSKYAFIPSGKVPAYFPYRAYGNYLMLKLKLNQNTLPTSTKFRACVLLDNEGEDEVGDLERVWVHCSVTSRQSIYTSMIHNLYPILTEHLYTFYIEAEEVTSTELVFGFTLRTSIISDICMTDTWKIKEWGIRQILEDPSY